MRQICTRCVMDSSDNTIRFDGEGHCNYCTDVLARMDGEYFPNAEGKRRLDDMMAKMKADCKDDKYDCMVGISGGIDSSYVLYLGRQYGLRMLGVHIDDGLDTETAKENIRRLCDKCGVELVTVQPDMEQYRDVIRSFFLAGVRDLAMPQDNLLLAALNDTAKKYDVRYSLSGANFAMESILQRDVDLVNRGDRKNILAIHKRFGSGPVDKLRFTTIFEIHVARRYFRKAKTLRPLDYIDYNLERVLAELKDFCGFEYYGGKHYESVLTRFLQCWYLPTYFDFDKRKSHFSSLIVSGQMTREEALEKLEKPAYPSKELMDADIRMLADFIGMTEDEFRVMLEAPKHKHSDYPISVLNYAAPVARRFRKWLA